MREFEDHDGIVVVIMNLFLLGEFVILFLRLYEVQEEPSVERKYLVEETL